MTSLFNCYAQSPLLRFVVVVSLCLTFKGTCLSFLEFSSLTMLLWGTTPQPKLAEIGRGRLVYSHSVSGLTNKITPQTNSFSKCGFPE